MVRIAAAVLTACVSLAGYSQEPDPKVTYSTVAVPVKRAVEEIAKATGAKIDVAGDILSEIVIISVTEAPLSELMSRLATVTSGEWTTEGGVRWLKYSKATFEKERKTRRTRRLAGLAASIKKIKEDLAAPKKNVKPQVFDEDDFLEPEPSPSSDATFRIASLLEPEVLVDIEGRTVFSNRPNGMQRPLPDVREIVSGLVDEHNKRASEIAKTLEEESVLQPKTVEEEQREQAWVRLFGVEPERRFINAPVSKVLLAVTADTGYAVDEIGVELMLFDSAGRLLISNYESLAAYVETDVGAFRAKSATEAPIDFSPLAREHAGVLFGLGRLSAEISDGLKQRLLRPDLYDPWSFADSEALLAVAKSRSMNLVANISDSELLVRLRNQITPSAYLATLASRGETAINDGDGWIELQPVDLIAARESRLNRRVLAALVKAGYEKGLPSLDDLAAFVKESPPFPYLAYNYIRFFAINYVYADQELLRLYAFLSPSQRTFLRTEGSLPVRTLDAAQRRMISAMVYKDVRYKVFREGAPLFEEADLLAVLGVFNRHDVDYLDEPTELLPQGLPPDATITLTISEEDAFYPSHREGEKRTYRGPMSPTDLASQSFTMSGETVPLNLIGGLGKRSVLKFKIGLTADASIEGVLYDDRVPKDGELIRNDALPRSFLDRVDRHLEKLRSLHKMLHGG
ncbi:MAG: hypothetical protein ACR2HJ_06225 [Fimbriimonadales bacterium]